MVDDTDGSIVRRVEPLYAVWLHAKGLVPDDFRLAPSMSTPLPAGDHPAWLQRQTVPLDHAAGHLHRIRLVEETPDGRWTTTTSWTTSGPVPSMQQAALSGPGRPPAERPPRVRDWVWVDLEHEPFGGRPVRPGSPRIVRDLMAAGEAHDGRMPLTADVLLATAAHVAELVDYLQDPVRQVPVLVFAHDPSDTYDQEALARDLARDLAGVAAVFRLGGREASEAFASALPDGFAVPSGALRTYLTEVGASGDLATRHRLLGRTSISSLGERALPAVKDQVLHLSTQRPGPLDAVTVRRLLSGTARAPRPGRSSGRPVETVLPWFRRQIARIRAVTGGDIPGSGDLTLVASAQDVLSHEIDRLLASRQGTGPTSVTVESTSLRTELAESEADREVLNQLLTEAAEEVRAAELAQRESADATDYLRLELAEAARAEEAARRRTRWLEARVAQLGASAWETDGTTLEIPHSVVEVLQLARERLAHVEIGPTDAAAAELDTHPGAELFAIKVWNALSALDDYTAAVRRGEHSGNFVSWCQAPPASRAAVSANAVALVESESVDNNPTLRDKRVFPVPERVAQGGRVYMPAHIRIVRRGTPAPRLHFHDDSRGASGVVHVGYVGQHLPTAQFR
ncbi:hypothetical protein ACI796_02280 [Geodermatophilus sp. SYSU D00525]